MNSEVRRLREENRTLLDDIERKLHEVVDEFRKDRLVVERLTSAFSELNAKSEETHQTFSQALGQTTAILREHTEWLQSFNSLLTLQRSAILRGRMTFGVGQEVSLRRVNSVLKDILDRQFGEIEAIDLRYKKAVDAFESAMR